MLVGEYILLLFLPGPIQSRKLDPNKSLQINNLSSLFFCVCLREPPPLYTCKSHLLDTQHVNGVMNN